jgi:hypothetical protein
MRNDKSFSAAKTMPAQTNPICEIVIDPRINDLNFGPPIASPKSPYPPPYRFLHCKSRWKHRHDTNETVTKVIEENTSPPLLKAFGRNIMPVPMKALSRVKNDLVVDASPGFFVRLELFRCPRRGLVSPGLRDSSSSVSIADSSSDSAKSSPAKLPYRSKNPTKFFVTGLVALYKRLCWR